MSDGAYVGPASDALELIEAELRRRHVQQRASGLIRLPRRSPKPEPPPEFWTRADDTMGAPVTSPVADAAAQLRQLLHERRVGGRAT